MKTLWCDTDKQAKTEATPGNLRSLGTGMVQSIKYSDKGHGTLASLYFLSNLTMIKHKGLWLLSFIITTSSIKPNKAIIK